VKPTNEPSHAFIVRIWIEYQESKDTEPIWRGAIEHVESGKQMYFDQLDKMRIYFVKYLEKIGIKVNTPRK